MRGKTGLLPQFERFHAYYHFERRDSAGRHNQ
jgi:hypothetical protein